LNFTSLSPLFKRQKIIEKIIEISSIICCFTC